MNEFLSQISGVGARGAGEDYDIKVAGVIVGVLENFP